MVVARFLGDPAYRTLLEGGSLTSPRTLAGDTALRERFKTETLAMHQRITGLADVSGKPQIPWPRKFGTPPWAVARQLSGTVGADGTPCDVLLARGAHEPAGRVPAAARRLAGRPGVGDLRRRPPGLPRHVALVVEATARGTLNVYDPARGRLDELDRLAFLGNRVDIAGWDVAWFVVTPES